MITRLNVVASVIFVAVFLFKSSSAQNNQFPNIPCPDVFQYTRSGNKNIGLITVRNVQHGDTTVAIELSQPGSIKLKNPGHLSLSFNKDKVFEYLSAGRPFTYRVDFPLQNIIPQVTSIQVNGVNICSGPAYNSPSTSMTLEHTLNVFSTNSYSPQEYVPNKIAKRPSSWPNFSQSSQVNSDIPGFLKFSPSFVQQMSMNQNSPNQQSNHQPSSFRQHSYDQSQSYQPTFNQPSYTSPSSFDQPYFSPVVHNQPSNHQPSSFGQQSYDPSQPYQPSYYSPSSFYEPAFNPSPYNQPSFTSPPAFNQPSYNPSTGNQPSYASPSSLNNPSFNPSPLKQNAFNYESIPQPPSPSFLKYTFPSFDQSGSDKPLFRKFNNNQPGFNNQQNSEFAMNPQNPFLSKSSGTNNIRPAVPAADRNNNPPIVAPTPDEAIQQSIFTPTPPLELDPRNIEPTTSPIPSTTTTIRPHSTLDYINSVCGRENLNIDMKTLNVKGQIIAKARFPWIVAVFKKNDDDDDPKFQCGGSLISTRTVLSAAHCFYLGFEAMRPEDIMVSIGRHNLSDVLDAFDINVERVIPHPDYRPRLTNFDADLAVVRLIQSVSFTTAVRPICMWQGNIDAREIEGVSGAIVGWGSDGRRSTTIIPTLVNATVVSELTCIRSNDQFISLTSNRTLCAGNLDGSGPCLGDSGNGLMIRNRNKWMLRGTVSATIGTQTRPCSLDQYAIYSDIAMFIEWIKSNMLL